MANVNLSQRDIDYIARVVDTEVPRSIQRSNPQEYQRMVGAVVDTVTNRMASGNYPTTATGVLNQSRQFSKITGPSFLNPYGSVQQTPKAPESVRNMVADRIAGAAAGEPSAIGGALNYANPNYSSKSSLRGWIDPMINAGAQAFGVGKNVHYHGTAPGQQPAAPYSVMAEGIPSGRIPAPSFFEEQPQRPSDNPFDSILTPAAYQAPSFPSTPAPVQREALPDVTPVAFDNSRFGAPAAAFDNSRFGPSPKTGRLAPDLPDQLSAFDAARFGSPATVTTTPQQLQRGLLDQQLNAGILPDLMTPPTNWPGQLAPAAAPTATTAYTDPMVTTSTEPASIKTARVQAPEVQSGLLSQPEYQQVQQQQALLGGPMAHSTPEQMQAMAAQASRGMQNRSLGGGLLGGLLGGLTLGPIGAIAGGLLGRNVAKNSYFPDAPKPSANSKNDKSLNDYGKSVSSSSGQFSRAMASGGKGLY
ncbi:hypothetical protein HLI01_22165 [Rhizobium laguerreae]|uniref:cell wall hydrolase n=1 Tax=Rhizobium laguerreae TaxID=1076926 RepID=UPI0014781BD2|nr:cell wall hydrolase [Rhizobium laguerreae]NNH59443.1 hypothetical protein [Rhizobium laguerreae]